MELKEFLHMKHDDGKPNAVIESKATSIMKPIMEKVVDSLLHNMDNNEVFKVLKVADLGCGVGHVPLALISTLIKVVNNKRAEMKWEDNQSPEIYIYFNDLASNDFNSLFKESDKLELNRDQKGSSSPLCLVMGVPGSFHGRLFPRNSLDFLHSNYAFHWLSQVPPSLRDKHGMSINKGNINLNETSSPDVVKAYIDQFQHDWTRFLNYRSQEVVSNGRVLFLVRGRSLVYNSAWELNLLAQALTSLVSKGLIEEEKWETFDFPVHCPYKEEIEEVVQKEGSFEVEQIEMILDETAWQAYDHDMQAKAEAIAKCVWGFTSVVTSHHFGQQISNVIYNELLQVTVNYLVEEKNVDILSILVLLRKK